MNTASINAAKSNLSFEDREQITLYSKTKIDVPSSEEMKGLVMKAQSGDQDAREKVILGTIRYIIDDVKKSGRPSWSGQNITVGDLIGESVSSLDNAIRKFDPTKGANFLTYASYWISIAQTEAIRKTREIAPSKNYIRYIGKLQGAIDSGISHHNHEQLAEATGIPLKTVVNVMSTMCTVSSIFDIVGGDDDKGLPQTVLDTIGTEALGPEKAISDSEIIPTIEKALTSLSDRDRQIMVLRYGLFEEEPHTLKEISSRLGITNERVRQIEEDCLKKLRNTMAEMNCSATSDIF